MKKYVVVLAVCMMFGGVLGLYTEASLTKEYKTVYEIYTVQEGDTLNGICIEYRAKDVREPYILEYMDEIKKLNPEVFGEKYLQPGDKLKISYKEEKK